LVLSFYWTAAAVPGVRFIALRGAPESPVVLAFLPRARNAVLRRFVEAAVTSAPENLMT
jgi:hypothetical protein